MILDPKMLPLFVKRKLPMILIQDYPENGFLLLSRSLGQLFSAIHSCQHLTEEQ